MAPPAVGIVTGLAREAALFGRGRGARWGARVLSYGLGANAAARAARDLVAAGCTSLVSFGFAGALADALEAGALLLPEAVLTLHGERWRTSEDWRARLLAANPDAATAAILGVDAVAATPAAKAALARRSGAIALDMESHGVGRVAAEMGLPFLVVRAVSDRREDVLPPWLLAAVDDRGTVRPAALARALLADPRRLAPLLTLGRGSRRAAARLRSLIRPASPLFQI